MYYDLNIPWPLPLPSSSTNASAGGKKKASKPTASAAPSASSSSTTRPDPLTTLDTATLTRLRTVTHDLHSLGYHTIAFNHHLTSRFDPTLHSNPFPPNSSGRPSAPFPLLDPRFPSNPPSNPSDGAPAPPPPRGNGLTQLSRLTLTLTDTLLQPPGHGLLNSHSPSLLTYDLLSVQPTSDATFSHACLTLSELKPFSIDIISLDLSSQPRLPWLLKRSTLNAALDNGVMLEVCYAPVLGAGAVGASDASSHLRARRNLISNVRDLVRITNGRNLIFSSGAIEALQLRGPEDVVNLASVFGLSVNAARDALVENPRRCIVRARTRKSWRGVVGPPVMAREVKADVDVRIVSRANEGQQQEKKRKQQQQGGQRQPHSQESQSLKRKRNLEAEEQQQPNGNPAAKATKPPQPPQHTQIEAQAQPQTVRATKKRKRPAPTTAA
ncbi:RNA-binding RNA processing protein rpp1 [Thecaphora frezii]